MSISEGNFVKLNPHFNPIFKYISIILQVYFNCTSEVYFKYTWKNDGPFQGSVAVMDNLMDRVQLSKGCAV